jgi:putative heme-binding domain-containing protein
VRKLLWRRLAIGNAAERTALVNALRQPGARVDEMLAEMAQAQKEQPDLEAPPGWAELGAQLMAGKDQAVKDRVAELALSFGDTSMAPLFRTWLMDKQRNVEQRTSALEGLVRQHDQATGPLLLDLLTDVDLRRSALTGLAAYELPETPARILAVLPSLDPTDREVALGTLCGRPASARAFLAAVGDGRASQRLLDAASLRRQLLALGDPGMEALLEKAWGRKVVAGASAEKEIARYKSLLTEPFLASADPSHGRALFARTCQACHTLYGTGGKVGPDLTGSNRADVGYLLANIIDPSAEVAKEYQLATLRLKDGRILSGNLVKDSRGVLVLRTQAGDQTILRRDLKADAKGEAAIERSKTSLMPEGQLQALTDEEARDLIAYLRSKAQVPLLASPENLGAFFNGHDLTGWDADPAIWSVENGELVGRTKTGIQNNDFAKSQLLLRDFRLVLEIKLTPDAANSGIQFRSEPAPRGEVKGYQADVGAGWWGILYEELGRAVLAKPSAKAEKPGEWNTYEILAVGDHVQLCLNGTCTVDLEDAKGAKAGIVAIQVHAGGPTEVHVRNFQLELDPLPVLSTQK